MDLKNNTDANIRKILLTALLISSFLSGYLYFINFEILGVSVNIHRIVLAICFVWCILMIFKKRLDKSILCSKPNLSIIIFLGGALIIGTVNLALGKNSNGALTELLVIACNLAYMLCFALLVGRDITMWLYGKRVFKIIGFCIAVLAYAEILFGLELPSSRFASAEYLEGFSVHPSTAYFTNENNLAAFMLMIAAIILLEIFCVKSSKELLKKAVQFVIVLLPMIITDSTLFRFGLYVCLIMSTIVFVKICGFSKLNFTKITVAYAISIVCCSVLKKTIRSLFFKFNLYVMHGVTEFDYDGVKTLITGDSLIGQLNNLGLGTFNIRKNLFSCSIDAAKESPILGSGANSFPDIFQNNPEYMELTGGMTNPHNFIAEVMVQYGIPLMLVFVSICAALFFISVKKAIEKKLDTDIRILYGSIAVLTVAFAFTTVMPSGFIKGPEYFIPLFLLVIGLDCLSNKNRRRRI